MRNPPPEPAPLEPVEPANRPSLDGSIGLRQPGSRHPTATPARCGQHSACAGDPGARQLCRRRSDGDRTGDVRPDRAGRVQPRRSRSAGPDAAWRSDLCLLPGAGESSSPAAGLLARSRSVREDVGDDAGRTRRLLDRLSAPSVSGVSARSATARPSVPQHPAGHHSGHARRTDMVWDLPAGRLA